MSLCPAVRGSSLQGELLPASPAVYFQVSGAPDTPEKLVNLLACPMPSV